MVYDSEEVVGIFAAQHTGVLRERLRPDRLSAARCAVDEKRDGCGAAGGPQAKPG
jgi:hypothetical protein